MLGHVCFEDELMAARISGQMPLWLLVWVVFNRVLSEGVLLSVRLLEDPSLARTPAEKEVAVAVRAAGFDGGSMRPPISGSAYGMSGSIFGWRDLGVRHRARRAAGARADRVRGALSGIALR